MTDAPIWEILGIDPTDDLGAIRRAYTARLKAIDTDAEPRRFAALREAYDAARSGMRDSRGGEAVEDAASMADLHEPADESLSITPADDGDRAEIQRLGTRIRSLLCGTEPIETIEAELKNLTLRMIAEINRETVDRQIAGEEWIIETIAAHLPRSDPMVCPAVASLRRQAFHGRYSPDRAMIVLDRLQELNGADDQAQREQAYDNEFNQMLETYGTGWLPKIMLSICLLTIAASVGGVLALLYL